MDEANSSMLKSGGCGRWTGSVLRHLLGLTRAAGICASAAACLTIFLSTMPRTASARATFFTGPLSTAAWSARRSCAPIRRSGASSAVRAQYSRRRGVLGRGRLPAARRRREAVQAHPARRHQSWRRDDRDHLPARQHRHAEPGEEIQNTFHFRGEFADRPTDRAPADRVLADPGGLGRCARLQRRPVRRPVARGRRS